MGLNDSFLSRQCFFYNLLHRKSSKLRYEFLFKVIFEVIFEVVFEFIFESLGLFESFFRTIRKLVLFLCDTLIDNKRTNVTLRVLIAISQTFLSTSDYFSTNWTDEINWKFQNFWIQMNVLACLNRIFVIITSRTSRFKIQLGSLNVPKILYV